MNSLTTKWINKTGEIRKKKENSNRQKCYWKTLM